MPWLSVSADGQGLCSKKKAVILKAWNKKDQTIMKCQRQKNEQRGYRMIYCVEDERNIRELLVYTLETTGFEAEGFETGAELDTAMKKNMPELILLDIMLPGEDGYNILKRLKSDTRTRDIPVIMVTAKEAEFDKVKGLEGGADDYITKPLRDDGICSQGQSGPSALRKAERRERAVL